MRSLAFEVISQSETKSAQSKKPRRGETEREIMPSRVIRGKMGLGGNGSFCSAY
jgi:hypothetical protein